MADLFSNLALGFSIALSPYTLMLAVIGCFLGTIIGALFIGILLQGLTVMNAPYYTQDFVKGAVLVVALVFTFALSKRGGAH